MTTAATSGPVVGAVPRRYLATAAAAAAALTIGVILPGPRAVAAPAADYVVHVSVDGLRPDAVTTLGPSQLPNIYRLRSQGAFTDNARTDVSSTVTLPNHTSILTGRGVLQAGAHNWTSNNDPPNTATTIHTNKGSYVASALDVAHDNGLRTGMWATKSKFSLYDQSYDNLDPTNPANPNPLQLGAPDTTGADNGRDKIDRYLFSSSSTTVTNDFVSQMGSNPFHYSFLHYHDPDTVGHGSGWMTTNYLNSVKAVDARLGQVFNLIDTNPALAGNTAIIFSADHGGGAPFTSHDQAGAAVNYTIPFYVWGAGVTPGDLYALNDGTRVDPGTGQPAYSATGQPIRNGDGGNLALSLLGLGPVPGSTINASQNLTVPEPGAAGLLALGAAAAGLARGRRRRDPTLPA